MVVQGSVGPSTVGSSLLVNYLVATSIQAVTLVASLVKATTLHITIRQALVNGPKAIPHPVLRSFSFPFCFSYFTLSITI